MLCLVGERTKRLERSDSMSGICPTGLGRARSTKLVESHSSTPSLFVVGPN
jgi:hypothetical protein